MLKRFVPDDEKCTRRALPVDEEFVIRLQTIYEV